METERTEGQYSVEIFLSAGKCNAGGYLPVQSLFQDLIDTATAHANSINLGYDRLIANNCAWVLSRVAVEMSSYPKINQTFRIVTWIVATNRFYSERAFRIEDMNGNTIGHAMTTWMAIEISERRAADLDKLFPEKLPDTGIRPDIRHSNRLAKIAAPDTVTDYRFRYCDIDCNRHVNSTRYVELILNMYSVEFFDCHTISNIEISYHAEARFGEDVKILTANSADNVSDYEIKRGDTTLTRIRITFVKK